MLALVWSLFKGMNADIAQSQMLRSGVSQAHPASGLAWQKRLALVLSAPGKKDVDRFLEKSALPALNAVANELARRSRNAAVDRDGQTGAVLLTVPAEGVRDFIYGVQTSEHKLPAFTAFEAVKMGVRYEARTFFSDGSRGYDIMGMSEEQIINDVLAQFERYLALVQSTETALLTAAPEH